ncbi:cyclic nucleotide-binding domain-containing protein [Bradyrhizobium canariense]|uniref:Cyclic nucleotide-binding domain-containing protein n=1 Tax=Bradyrhizobium canariense TaxID=255045 RepID=A0A1H1QTQ0_9BRAD|nr:cyclic nucleotide-binding domain-containing protein [Bradyrhizobium canariense]SDS26820.1 Cyclic nucleotide-binding domain-containing protein [Bradyrhizobium canariense]
MTGLLEIVTVSLVGLVTTSSSLLGAVLGLYVRLPKTGLAAILAFAAGSLISALAIELAYESALQLHHQGFAIRIAWLFVGSGFGLGAAIYYCGTMFLEQRGAAIRFPTRFREYALSCKRKESEELINLLCRSDLMRHLPPDRIEALLPCIRTRKLQPGEVLFRAGDQGDALYIVKRGRVDVVPEAASLDDTVQKPIATLSEGQTFGEMALITGNPRTATIRAATESELLSIGKNEFERLTQQDQELANVVRRLSHERAISNLSANGLNPSKWAAIATSNVQHMSRSDSEKLLVETSHGAGLAIVLGNILDTIPGCLVIGAKFGAFQNLSLSLMLGMFIGGIPEAAASASILQKAGYRPRTVLLLWSMVLVTGIVSAAAGYSFIGSSESLTAIFCQAIAGGAVLALVAHAMIPEAIHQGGSAVVLPTVAGFLFALYFALASSPV